METERIKELYEKNKKEIMKAVRKLPAGFYLEVAFYESGRVWISQPLNGGAYMDWHPDFFVQYHADRFASYKGLEEGIDERILEVAGFDSE